MPTIASPARLIPEHLSVSHVFVIIPADMPWSRCEDAIGRVLAAHGLRHHGGEIIAAHDGAHLDRRDWLHLALETHPARAANPQVGDLALYDAAVRRVRSLIYATLAALRHDLGLTGQPTT